MFPLKDTVRARDVPVVNWLLIGANVLAFVVETSLGPVGLERFVHYFGVVPTRFLHAFGFHEVLTIFTSMFLHGGWFHLISNMWALYLFGDNVEDRMGHGRYLVFYLLTGAVASLTHIFFNPDSPVPTVGASGAISGVLGAYLVLFPTARVVTLVPLWFFFPWFVEIPALIYLGMWFVSQLFNGLFALAAPGVIGTYGGVAWWAHVGGFVAGLLLVKAFERRRERYYYVWYPDEYWPW
ncbi:MAG TPA: rhomboid family intramembrane serine protease [Chloroflexi bacterium]|nr:rhomboid family intramembrane serine protease [Chloroflexota bacterium]